MPTDVLACCPRSPNRLTNRSEQPLITSDGYRSQGGIYQLDHLYDLRNAI